MTTDHKNVVERNFEMNRSDEFDDGYVRSLQRCKAENQANQISMF